MSDLETIEIQCSDCGSKDFEFPANPKPDDVVTCSGCGRKDTYGAILQKAESEFIDFLKKGPGGDLLS